MSRSNIIIYTFIGSDSFMHQDNPDFRVNIACSGLRGLPCYFRDDVLSIVPYAGGAGGNLFFNGVALLKWYDHDMA